MVGLFFVFIVVIVFFIIIVFEVFRIQKLVDLSGLGEVEAGGGGVLGGCEDVADGAGGGRVGVEARGVRGGELEAVEKGGGSLDLEVAGGEGVDDLGEGDLDVLAVLDRAELDVLAGQEIALGDRVEAVRRVALVETRVEVAEVAAVEGDAFALKSVGLDVPADGDVHWDFLLGGGTPRGVVVKSRTDATS